MQQQDGDVLNEHFHFSFIILILFAPYSHAAVMSCVYLDLIILDDTIAPVSHVQVCSLDCQQQPSCQPTKHLI